MVERVVFGGAETGIPQTGLLFFRGILGRLRSPQ